MPWTSLSRKIIYHSGTLSCGTSFPRGCASQLHSPGSFCLHSAWSLQTSSCRPLCCQRFQVQTFTRIFPPLKSVCELSGGVRLQSQLRQRLRQKGQLEPSNQAAQDKITQQSFSLSDYPDCRAGTASLFLCISDPSTPSGHQELYLQEKVRQEIKYPSLLRVHHETGPCREDNRIRGLEEMFLSLAQELRQALS